MKRSWLALAVVSVAVIGMASALFAGQTALAFIRESRITLPAGQTVQRDLDIEAAAIELDGDVNGDVSTRSIYFKSLGTIDGDVRVSTGVAEFRGEIAGDVDIRAIEARIYGVIEGDLAFNGVQLTIMEGATILGDVRVNGRSLVVTATSTVTGNVDATLEQLVIEGTIGNGVTVTARSIHITDGSLILGGMQYRSPANAVIDSGAEIQGPVQRDEFLVAVPGSSALFWQAGWIAVTALLAVFGLVLYVLGSPERAETGRSLMSLRSIVPGLGLLGLLPIMLLVASMYVVTIPFVLLGLVGYVLFLGWCLAAGAFSLGEMLLPARWSQSAIACLAAGVVLFALLYLICPIPALAPLLFASCGAGLLTRNERTSQEGSTRWLLISGSGTLGFVATMLALTALTVGAVASAAAIVTLSGSASLVWEYSPITFGIVAWLLATAALVLPVIAFEWTETQRRRAR